MTVLELNIATKAKLQKLDSAAYMDIRSELIDYSLYVALVRIVKSRYSGNNPKKTAVEQTEKRSEDLGELVVPTKITSSTVGFYPNGFLFSQPTDYWFALSESATVNYTDCNCEVAQKRVKLRRTTFDRVEKMLDDPFNSPDLEDGLLRARYNAGIEVIAPDDVTIASYNLVYIKKPKYLVSILADYGKSVFNISNTLSQSAFTDTLELSNEIELEIVEEAVTILTGDVESPRYQVQLNELLKVE